MTEPPRSTPLRRPALLLALAASAAALALAAGCGSGARAPAAPSPPASSAAPVPPASSAAAPPSHPAPSTERPALPTAAPGGTPPAPPASPPPAPRTSVQAPDAPGQRLPLPSPDSPGTGPPIGAEPEPTSAAAPPPELRPGPVPAPPTADRPSSSPRQAELDRQRQLLRSGRIAYQVPTQMTDHRDVTVAVSVAGADAPPDFPSIAPSVVVAPLLVGSDVQADLTGDGFTITRVDGDDGRRTLASGTQATWQWQVTPLRTGQHTLFVSLYVRVDGEGGAPTDVRTFSQPVDVAVNPSYTIGQLLTSWLPAAGLTVPVLLGGVAVLARWRRGRSGHTRGRAGTHVVRRHAGPVRRASGRGRGRQTARASDQIRVAARTGPPERAVRTVPSTRGAPDDHR